MLQSLSGVLKSLLEPALFNRAGVLSPVRFASTGGNRNPRKSKGSHKGIKKRDGTYVYPGDILVYRQGPAKIWFHPGLNVVMARRRMNLVAKKEGVVRVTCEKPDLNFDAGFVKLFYSERKGQTFYKKYFNVIPLPQHTMFKCTDQV